MWLLYAKNHSPKNYFWMTWPEAGPVGWSPFSQYFSTYYHGNPCYHCGLDHGLHWTVGLCTVHCAPIEYKVCTTGLSACNSSQPQWKYWVPLYSILCSLSGCTVLYDSPDPRYHIFSPWQPRVTELKLCANKSHHIFYFSFF